MIFRITFCKGALLVVIAVVSSSAAQPLFTVNSGYIRAGCTGNLGASGSNDIYRDWIPGTSSLCGSTYAGASISHDGSVVATASAQAQLCISAQDDGISVSIRHLTSQSSVPSRRCIMPQAAATASVHVTVSARSVVTFDARSQMRLPTWFSGSGSPTHAIFCPEVPGSLWNIPAGYVSAGWGECGWFGIGVHHACACNIDPPSVDIARCFANPGNYRLFMMSDNRLFSLGCTSDDRSTPPGDLETQSNVGVSFERCLTVLSQPGDGEVCDGVAVLSVSAQSAVGAGETRYEWQWKASQLDPWLSVNTGLNTRGEVSFTTLFTNIPSLIADFSPGRGVLPSEARPQFRCRVWNDCTSDMSSVGTLRTCGCPSQQGQLPARWKRALFDSRGQFEGLVAADLGQIDCSKPVALVAHGWNSDPNVDWVRCLSQAAHDRGEVRSTVLVADASAYMNPVDPALQGALEAARLSSGLSPWIRVPAMFANALERGLNGVKEKIPLAADDLYRDLACFTSCGEQLDVNAIYGHSFGGGIGAEVGARLAKASGRQLPLLFTIDTPWSVAFVRMDEQRDIAARYFSNHVNYYSCDWYKFAFGAYLVGTNTRNFNAGPGITVRDRCRALEFQHNCLPRTACEMIPGASALLNGLMPPGNYQEGQQAGSIIPGDPSDGCTSVDFPELEDATYITADLTPDFSISEGVQMVGPPGDQWLEITQPQAGRATVTAQGVQTPSCPGYLVFEYQVSGLDRTQVFTMSRDGAKVWRTMTDTPLNQWQLGVIHLAQGCRKSFNLVARLEALLAGGNVSSAVIRVRNVRVIPPDVVACTAAPQIVTHPVVVAECDQDVALMWTASNQILGVVYQWHKNGIPITDGPTAGGGMIHGASGPILAIEGFTASNYGVYNCKVSNSCGATLTQTTLLGSLTCCAADFNADTVLDFFDYLDFVSAFAANEPAADFNADTVIDFFDYLDFVAAFADGC